MAKITDIGHVALRTPDVERALGFYAKLGIHEAFRLTRDDGSLILIYLHIAGDRFIELFPSDAASYDKSKTFFHLCLVVDDLKELVESLKAEGIPIDTDIKEGLDYNLQAWTHDPDGNPIEFMQLSERSPQRKKARGEQVNF